MNSPAPFYAELADGPEGGRAVWLKTADGTRIRIAVWNATAASGTGFLLPGRTEYVEKYGRAATDLAQRGFATLVIDWRGQGLAQRALADPMTGHVGNFDEYQDDLETALAFARAEGLPEPYYMLAHSMGGCIGLRGLIRGLPFRAVSFSAPMWGILISAWTKPLAVALSSASRWLHFDHRYAPGTGAKTYVLASPFALNVLTTDEDMWDYMADHARARPELSLGGPSFGWVRAALSECHALSLLPSPAVRCVCALGKAEKVVASDAIRSRMAAWPEGRLDLYPGAEHEVMMERPETRKRFFDSTAALFDASR